MLRALQRECKDFMVVTPPPATHHWPPPVCVIVDHVAIATSIVFVVFASHSRDDWASWVIKAPAKLIRNYPIGYL